MEPEIPDSVSHAILLRVVQKIPLRERVDRERYYLLDLCQQLKVLQAAAEANARDRSSSHKQ